MRRLGRLNDWPVVAMALLGIVPFHWAIASRTNLAIYELAVLAMFGLLFLSGSWRLSPRYFRLAISVFVTFIWILASCLWSADKNIALNAASIYGIAALLFIGLLAVFEKSNRQKLWLYGYLLVAATVSVIGLVTLNVNNSGRLEIGLMLSNAAAGFLLPAVLFVLFGSRRLAGRSPVTIILLLAGALVILAGFIMTFSRGGWFCLAAAALFIAWFRYSKKTVLLVVAICVILLASLVGLSNHLASSSGNSWLERGLGRNTSITLEDRKVYAKSAYKLWTANPIVGAGAGSFRIEGVSGQSEASIYSVNAHASLLQFAAEFGIVGLALLASVVWQIIRLTKLTKPQLVIIGATLALALHFLIEIDLLYPPLVFLLASLSALSISNSSTGKAS